MDVDLGLSLAQRSLERLKKTKDFLISIGFEVRDSETRLEYVPEVGKPIVIDLLCGGEPPEQHATLVVPRIADHVELAFSKTISSTMIRMVQSP
ncbi:hypothetical protein ACFL2H_06815 [Planctomycetota bacterium]